MAKKCTQEKTDSSFISIPTLQNTAYNKSASDFEFVTYMSHEYLIYAVPRLLQVCPYLILMPYKQDPDNFWHLWSRKLLCIQNSNCAEDEK